MAWIVALIVVLIAPLAMILWWIPRCDAISIRKGKTRAVAPAIV
jgi:hypothetical protein